MSPEKDHKHEKLKRRFTSILAFIDAGPEAFLYRLDYLPRRQFDKITGSPLFDRSPALRVGKLLNNLLYAMIADEKVWREVERIAHRGAAARGYQSRYGESRMKAPIRVEDGIVTPVPLSLWSLRAAQELRREDEGEQEDAA